MLETAMSKVGFVDLLGNGNLQIMLTSVFGMGNNTALYVFDLNGREISRQTSTCEAFADLDTHAAVACPISTETDIEIKRALPARKTWLPRKHLAKKFVTFSRKRSTRKLPRQELEDLPLCRVRKPLTIRA